MTTPQITNQLNEESKYSAVFSWILDFEGNEIDERTHGFILNSCVPPEQRATIISGFLRGRMWCDIDAEYIDQDEFNLGEYDSTHYID